jgi:hypothetical protein
LEEVLARTFQFSIAIMGAFTIALWFALVIWTYRDVVSRSRSSLMHVFSTLIVVLFFIPGTVIYLLLRPRETLDERQQRWVEEEYLAQELEDVAICPSCSHGVRDEWIYCPACRFQLRRPCLSCGRLVEAGWEVCAFCGVDLRASSERQPIFSSEDASEQATLNIQAPRALQEDSVERRTTADGQAFMLDPDDQADSTSSTDAPESETHETGELPVPEVANALESGARQRRS